METPQTTSVHAFPAASLASLPAAHISQTPIQQSVQAADTDRARAYKSRNKRPCDFCRYKKAACHLEHQPPCELCIRYGKDCTFVESPAKRRRPNNSSNEDGSSNDLSITNPFMHSRNGSMDSSAFLLNGEDHGFHHQQFQSLNRFPAVGDNYQWDGLDFALDPFFLDDADTTRVAGFGPKSGMTLNDSRVDKTAAGSLITDHALALQPEKSSETPRILSLPFDLTSGEPSLDQQGFSNSTIVGLSGDTDPYLLSRYRFDQYNEATFQSTRIRKMNDSGQSEGTIPTFVTIQHNGLASKAQPQEKPDALDRYRSEVEGLVDNDVGKRLIRLFYRYVQPYFPVLSREGGGYPRDVDGCREPSNIPTALLAAIYGHALPFCAWDDKLCVEVYLPPSADALFRIAWAACVPILHTPSLAALQTLLLLVQRRPTNKNVGDTPFKGVMISAAVSIAQYLGLNRDPTDWPLPAWEIRLRRRLAAATFIQDRWLALNSGRMGHIQSDDWEIDVLSVTDLAEQDRSPDHTVISAASQHFIKLYELTSIVDDILRDLFTVKATKRLQHNLESTLEVVKPLRMRLAGWHQSLVPGLLPETPPGTSPLSGPRRKSSVSHELDGSGSLYLAYITAKIELFRAMLRPAPSDADVTAASALRTGASAIAHEVHDFLENLNARELEAFWGSYSRTNFTIASSFMLLLFVTSPDIENARECLELLCTWRALLRVKSRSCDLLNLALLRLDAVFVAGMDKLIELSPSALQAWEENELGKL